MKYTEKLQPRFSPLGMWSFSIGTSIGWGSFIVTCNTYLLKSGILGTVLGLIIGMAVIFVVTWNLQYMIQYKPDAGGIYAFERKVGGKDLGFLAMWFILLTYLAILWANITSVPLFARFFLGTTFQFGFHYHIFGYEVWMGEALLSILALVLVGLLCVKGSKVLNKVMVFLALLFAAAFSLCAVIALTKHDRSFSYTPLFAEGSGAFSQIVRIAVISPWAFIGFENISHFSEEFAFPARKVKGILIGSVIVTTLLYLFVSLLSISAYPPEYSSWLEYIKDMGNLEGIKAVPAFYAANYYLGKAGVTVLMFALFAVIITSLIGNMMALSRLLFSAARNGEANRTFAALDKNGVPMRAFNLIIAVSVVMPFFGRTAIGWIVDVTTLGATIIYTLVSYAVFKHAKQINRKTERITGFAGMVLMSIFVLLLLIPGLLPFHAMETVSYVLFIIWALMGLGYFRIMIRREGIHNFGQRVVVWIILLVMVLFASMMWVSRATETAANNAVQRIFEYHETHPTDDSDLIVREQRIEYLQEQAEAITRTNTLYSLVSLLLFVLIIAMMLNNYRDTQKLGERLSEAEKEAETAKRIAQLKDTISSLLDNMPGMTFTKDARSGVYLACNQAFANYAHKKTPDGVVGLTDAQIFDDETAAHFVEDDRMALAMDQPFIFTEDVPDAVGNQRQFQTTKLKYVDTTGRLCILGMCQDITDIVSIQRENATNKEAYETARNNAVLYSHIAQSLVHGYSSLYYVDLETEDFIEFRTHGEHDLLTENRKGTKFFETIKRESEKYVYPDDREAFVKALDRRFLAEALEHNNNYISTYRILVEDKPVYVSTRVTRMEDDRRFIIIGIANIDEQMQQRKEAERMREEQIAYRRLNVLTGDFICVYVIDPETSNYREFSSTKGYESFDLTKEGEDFFETTRESMVRFGYHDDVHMFLEVFTKENVMDEIRNSGMFTLCYRLMMGGKSVHVRLKAAMLVEKEGPRLIVGVINIDSQVRQEEEYAKRLAQAQRKANIDALTGVRNRHAYLEFEEQMNIQIAERNNSDFAIVILDVNDLKCINDNEGHNAGDKYLKDACKAIKSIFKDCFVFRIGGDEFAVVAQDKAFAHVDEFMTHLGEYNNMAAKEGCVVVAGGMAKFDDDACVATVFDRADQAMYDNKSSLKRENCKEKAMD